MDKKRIIRYLGIGFWIVMLALFIYVGLKFSIVKHEVDVLISAYGYLAIFLIAFTVDMLMQPIGPDVPLVGGILLGANIYGVLFATITGATLASLLSFKLGKIYGKHGFDQLYSEKTYKRAHKYFSKYGRAGMVMAALTPLPYVPMCWVAGMFKMSFKDFVIFGLVSRTFRLIGVAFIVWLISV